MAKPVKWYSLKEICAALGMDKRAFERNVHLGVFPNGLIRPGEKQKKWTSDDLQMIEYRASHDHRFATPGTTAGGEEIVSDDDEEDEN